MYYGKSMEPCIPMMLCSHWDVDAGFPGVKVFGRTEAAPRNGHHARARYRRMLPNDSSHSGGSRKGRRMPAKRRRIKAGLANLLAVRFACRRRDESSRANSDGVASIPLPRPPCHSTNTLPTPGCPTELSVHAQTIRSYSFQL